MLGFNALGRLALGQATDGGASTAMAVATPGLVESLPDPVAASAVAGRARTRNRAGRICVRFVSKRRTVAVFAGSMGDRHHTTTL